MHEIAASPDQLRALGARVQAAGDCANALAARAQSLASGPMRHQFPSVPEGQRLAGTWDEARQTFATGLALVARRIAGLGNGLQQTADGFRGAETSASAQVRPAHKDLQLPL